MSSLFFCWWKEGVQLRDVYWIQMIFPCCSWKLTFRPIFQAKPYRYTDNRNRWMPTDTFRLLNLTGRHLWWVFRCVFKSFGSTWHVFVLPWNGGLGSLLIMTNLQGQTNPSIFSGVMEKEFPISKSVNLTKSLQLQVGCIFRVFLNQSCKFWGEVPPPKQIKAGVFKGFKKTHLSSRKKTPALFFRTGVFSWVFFSPGCLLVPSRPRGEVEIFAQPAIITSKNSI